MSESEKKRRGGRPFGAPHSQADRSGSPAVPVELNEEAVAAVLTRYKVTDFIDPDEGDDFEDLVSAVTLVLKEARTAPRRVTEKLWRGRILSAKTHLDKGAKFLSEILPEHAASVAAMADQLEDELESGRDLAAEATGHALPQTRRHEPDGLRNPVYEMAVNGLFPLLRSRLDAHGGQAMMIALLGLIDPKAKPARVRDNLRDTYLPRAREVHDLREQWLRETYQEMKRRHSEIRSRLALRREDRANRQGGKKH